MTVVIRPLAVQLSTALSRHVVLDNNGDGIWELSKACLDVHRQTRSNIVSLRVVAWESIFFYAEVFTVPRVIGPRRALIESNVNLFHF